MIIKGSALCSRIKGLSYYQNFVSQQQKAQIYNLINSNAWCLHLRRAQQYYGIKYFQTRHLDQTLQSLTSLQSTNHYPLSHFNFLIQRLCSPQYNIFNPNYPPNQCLVNKYNRKDYLGMHVEDQQCYGEIVVGLSFGNDQYLRLNHKQHLEGQYYMQIKDKSLYVLKDHARYLYKHGIGRIAQGQSYKSAGFQRISLTFRHVIQTRRKL